MTEQSAVVRRVLQQIPMSTRALAQEANLDEKLLRMIRDGDRRLTPKVRERLITALRHWRDRLDGALEELETAELETSEGGEE